MKYLPNLVTLCRVILTIILNIYIFLDFGEILVPLILTTIIFSSDFADGWLARKYNVVTKFGVGFDAFADIFYVALSYAVLTGYHILPFVGLILILFKFFEFLITSAIINARQNYSNANSLLIFDQLGKSVGILFYITPIVTYVIHQSFRNNNYAVHFFFGVAIGLMGIMVILSSWHRIVSCIKITRQSNT
jgi:phosphatidylglycerophosphate synthase